MKFLTAILKMNRLKKYLIFVILLCTIIYFLFCFIKNRKFQNDAVKFANKFESAKVGDTVYLKDLTSLLFDKFLVIGPYSSNELFKRSCNLDIPGYLCFPSTENSRIAILKNGKITAQFKLNLNDSRINTFLYRFSLSECGYNANTKFKVIKVRTSEGALSDSANILVEII